MTEASERVRGVRDLPLFPLPVVIFPGVPMPLHIFEDRYRKLLKDVTAGNKLFGLSFFDASESALSIPSLGHVGCAAEVTEIQPLPDGRSNILSIGLIRYRLESYVEAGEPYLVGRVTFFEDEPEDILELREEAESVAKTFMRIAQAVRIISDERSQLPELPADEPERLSFLMAGAMDMENETKLELLEMRSTSKRLEKLRDLLGTVVDSYEERARVHGLAKSNGHSGKKIDLQ
jgi:ATP-dependent Lon protease